MTPDPALSPDTLAQARAAAYTYSPVRRAVQRVHRARGWLAAVIVAALGWDVSTWNPVLYPAVAKSKNLLFIFIRALYGLTLDTKFFSHWGTMHGNAPRGAYLYYKDNLDPVTQANKLFETCQQAGHLGELPPVVDVESFNNPTLTAGKIKKCCERLTVLFGRKPLIYTGFYVWRDHVTGDKSWASAYELWLAGYPFSDFKPAYVETVKNYPPLIPYPWTAFDVWQWTAYAPGPEYGASSNYVDLNYCSPSFATKYNISSPPPPEPPPTGDEVKQAKCLLTQLNVRNTPAKTLDVGDIVLNEIVNYYPADTVTKPGEEWLHVRKTNNVVGWAARKHPDFPGVSLEPIP